MTSPVHLSDRQSFNKRLHKFGIEVLLLRLLERLEDRTFRHVVYRLTFAAARPRSHVPLSGGAPSARFTSSRSCLHGAPSTL